MHTPRVYDWVLNPNYSDTDPDSIFRQPITKISGLDVQTLSFDSKHQFTKVSFSANDLVWSEDLHAWEHKPKSLHPTQKQSWVGVFNWYGKLHQLETHAVSKEAAFRNMCSKLASKLKQSTPVVVLYFTKHQTSFSLKVGA